MADEKKEVKKSSLAEKFAKKKKEPEATKKEEKKKKLSLKEVLHGSKKKKVAKSASKKRSERKDYLLKAGITADPRTIERWMLRITIGILGGGLIYLLYLLIISSLSFTGLILYGVIGVGIGGPLVYGVLWVLLFLFANLAIFRRTKELEEALPEYLELCALNVKAGMPIDRALWFSVRPRFGVLAKEIEVVAKRTITGDPLVASLRDFAARFESPALRRTISLITEGVESGGELGALLHSISADLRDTKILKQEMASSVTTYVIFITFAAIVAAPGLMALSYHLLVIIQGFASRLDPGSAGGSVAFSISPNAISLDDYTKFAILTLSLTGMLSASIISIIRHGNVKEGITFIPLFALWSVFLFFICVKFLGSVFGGVLAQ